MPVRPAATVMLVRDDPAFEVLMVRRHHEIEFASGALVFPGGKLDAGDRDPAWAAHLMPDELGETERALRICAIREAFEESGLLLARDPADASIETPPAAAMHRDAVATGRMPFLDLVASLGLVLDLGLLHPFAHWITPAGLPKRFDTRFFLMTAPAGGIAACDGYETVDAEWITPAEALRLRDAGERTILFPTRLNLALLGRSNSVAEAIEAARFRKVVPIEPTLGEREGRTVVSIPANVGYGPVEPQPL